MRFAFSTSHGGDDPDQSPVNPYRHGVEESERHDGKSQGRSQ